MKKVNLILITIGSVLTIKYGFGYIFYIPIMLFYLKKDYRILFLLIPFSILSVFVFDRNNIFTILLLSLLFIIYVVINNRFIKKSKINAKSFSLINYLCIIIFNILSFLFIENKYKIYIYIIFIIVSIAILIFLDFEDYIFINNIIKTPCIFTEQIIIIIATLGGLKTNIYGFNIGFLFAAYFILYYVKNFKNVYSLLLAVILFIIIYLGFGELSALLLLIILMFYNYQTMYIFCIFNIILTIILLTTDVFNPLYIYSLMILTITDEILSLLLNSKKIININKNDYVIENKVLIENEYDNFNNFISYFADSFKSCNKYNQELDMAYSLIINSICKGCTLCDECFSCNNYRLSKNVKLFIEGDKLEEDFKEYCPNLKEIENKLNLIKPQMSEKENAETRILQGILNQFSLVLKKYRNDIRKKEIISYKSINDFYEKINSSIYYLSRVVINKAYVDDYDIDIYIDGKGPINCKEIMTLLTKSFPYASNVRVVNESKNSIFKITPKCLINNTYGYGSFASKENDFCGDHHFFKNYTNGHFISIISDGMGKGIKAYMDSRKVIEAIELLSDCSSQTYTNISILNILYILQGYVERYSTFDVLDINKTSNVASFYKLGAACSYIVHDDGTYIKIDNKSLPLGIEEEVTYEEYILHEKDIILMGSDGIFGNLIKEEELIEISIKLKNEAAQKISYELINFVLNNQKIVKDDMTIIVIKIERCLS